MSQQAQVRVAGPSRGGLAAATGALVALTSGATAFVVLTGTGGVVPDAPSLEPLPPAAAPPAYPPVVVLPPGAFAQPAPAQADAPRPTAVGGAGGTTSLVLAAPPSSPGLRALLPEVAAPERAVPGVAAPAPVAVPRAAPPSADDDPQVVRRLERTLERRQDPATREILSAPAPDSLDAMPPGREQAAADRRWDEQDEREQRHARSARRAVPGGPATPAVVTIHRAVTAAPAAVVQQGRRAPAVVQERAARPQQRSRSAGHRKAAATSSPGSSSRGTRHSAGKKPDRDKGSSRPVRARPDGARS